MTACGGIVIDGDGGTDAATDAKPKKDDGGDAGNGWNIDAGQSDAFDPPDAVESDVVTIKPPIIH